MGELEARILVIERERGGPEVAIYIGDSQAEAEEVFKRRLVYGAVREIVYRRVV